MEDLLFNQYCQKKFGTDSNIFDDDEKEAIMDTLGFRCYILLIEFDNLKKEIIEELKRIFRIK